MKLITIITSFFRADDYIIHFFNNVKNIIGYKKYCMHIAYNINGSHKNNTYIETLLNNFSKLYSNFKVINIDIKDDKGLYYLWNQSVKNSTTKYMMTLNIDDMCKSSYIIESLKYINKYNPDLISSYVNVTKKKNAVFNDYYTIWYNYKKIYYDSRINVQYQLKKANIIRVNNYFFETKCNRQYKILSKNIPTKFKKSIKVKFKEYCLEDMFIDWNDNNNYTSYCMPHCTPIWKTKLHNIYGYFDEKNYGIFADFEFWLRLLKNNCYFLSINKPLILYLEDDNSLERRSKDREFYMNKIKDEYL